MSYIDRNVCPASILKFVQRRLGEIDLHDSNPSLLRKMLLPEIPNPWNCIAEIRQFSSCNPDLKSCSGDLLGRWLATPDSVKPLDATSLRDVRERNNSSYASVSTTLKSIDDPLFARVINFALSLNEHFCVINEIDLEGNLTLAVYKYSNKNHDELGAIIGVPLVLKYHRKRWDNCFPEQWPPPAEQPR